MSIPRRKRLVAALTSVCVTALLAAVGGLALGGEAPAKAKPSAEKKEQPKFRGRLPMYYGDVVSQKQREQIYGIQAKYADQIEQLQKQLDELKASRDAEVEAVLTPEQQAKVKERTTRPKPSGTRPERPRRRRRPKRRRPSKPLPDAAQPPAE